MLQGSSQLESSDSESSKRRERERREQDKKHKREKEKEEKLREANVDIELCETETFVLLVQYTSLHNLIDRRATFPENLPAKKTKQP